MQAKTILLTIFVALAAALPSPAETTGEVTQGPYPNPDAPASEGDVSLLAVKNWQAAGGCKRDWDEDRRCVNQCIGEANSKCVGWKSMTGVLQGGCVISWNTCRCVCEY
ncbi:hypothetical protein CPLU01_11185 [Colletotrichum plurivorum]|uniref:Invertebrate defensins family profile domain-containing protein n=1 Tax=Colletotrichum plurivorum TaxID=2175906 RepID=A0A8H6N905_9PEZI|nr:hypothetical protein CPLU01_11185 [Colletotrichum plurivorum]